MSYRYALAVFFDRAPVLVGQKIDTKKVWTKQMPFGSFASFSQDERLLDGCEFLLVDKDFTEELLSPNQAKDLIGEALDNGYPLKQSLQEFMGWEE